MGYVGVRVALGQFCLPTCFGFPVSVAFHQMNAAYISLTYHQRHIFLATDSFVFCSKIDGAENRK
jgi:hypothetical protein